MESLAVETAKKVAARLMGRNAELMSMPAFLILIQKPDDSITYSDVEVRDGKNRDKQRIRVALAYEKIANQRKDFLHKLSTRLIRENQAVALEDLSAREKAWDTVETMAGHIGRDHPHEALEAARKTVDLTGAYRLLALLLTGAA